MKAANNRTDKKSGRGMSAKSTIFVCFVFFTAVAVALLALLQVFFLKYIYRAVKVGELEDACRKIVEECDDVGVYRTASELADDYDICVQIYNPTTASRTKLTQYSPGGCLLYELSGNDCMKIYLSMTKSGESRKVLGVRLGESAYSGFDGTRTTSAETEDFSIWSADDQGNVVLCVITENSDGDDILVMVNSFLTPVSALTRTIGIILAVVAVFLVLLSVIIVGHLSGKIAKPLRRMNNRAKLLGEGNYGVRFDENAGYTEANELAATLNQAASDLSKVDKLRNELIANISHDLRTPLTLISGYSEIMRDFPSEVTAANLQTIIDESARLSSLVNDLLEISKIQSGNIQIKPEKFDLSEELDKTLETYKTLAGKMGYNITLEKEGDGNICADRALVIRAVNNLVNNAMTYTGADKKIALRMTGSRDSVRIEVSDSGMGIPADKLNLIWDRYYKVDAEHKRAAQGSGLGLSIVRSIMLMHSGKYGVRSREGSGSTFWIEFPREYAGTAEGE